MPVQYHIQQQPSYLLMCVQPQTHSPSSLNVESTSSGTHPTKTDIESQTSPWVECHKS